MNSKYRNLLIAVLTILSLAGIAFTAQAQLAFSLTENNGNASYKVKNLNGSFDVEYDGNIVLSDDDKDIVSISRGGFFTLSKSSFGASRKVKIESYRDGLSKRYYVGWSEEEWEPEGRRWLAEVLPDLVRSTTIAAKARVDRIYKNGGSTALVDELMLLNGDYVSNTYFELAFEKQLTEDDQSRLLKVAGETISSDHYLSQILSNYLNQYGLTSRSVDNFVTAADKIQSDHYKSNVILSIAKSDEISGQVLTQLIKGTNGIQSDHYKSNALIELIDKKNLDDGQVGTLLVESRDIESDHYLANLLIKVVQEHELSSSTMDKLIETSNYIQSDTYKSNVFKELLVRRAVSADKFKLVFAALEDIQSDTYLSNILIDFAKKDQDQESIIEMLNLAGNSIGSDYYLSLVLIEVANNQKLNGPSLDAFLMALRSVSSDHYATNVYKELTELDISEESMIRLLKASSVIDSDHYLSTSLITLSRKVNSMGDRVKEAYRSAAREISSDTYYGKAMKALDY